MQLKNKGCCSYEYENERHVSLFYFANLSPGFANFLTIFQCFIKTQQPKNRK